MNVGDKFGRLTIVKLLPPINKKYKVLTKCECGTEKVLYKNALGSGRTKSCGCLLKEFRASHPWIARKRTQEVL